MSTTIIRGIVGSPYMRAVIATHIEKGLDWRVEPVAPGMHKAPEYLARHPFGRIPVIERDGFELYETQAILRYVDRLTPTPALTPADPKAAARMDQAMNINDWYLFRMVGVPIGFNRSVAPKLGFPVDEAVVAAAVPDAKMVFAAIEGFLGDQAFMAGETLSLADLQMAPHVDMLAEAPECAAILKGTRLAAWLERMRARPSVATTSWEALAAKLAA
jgi:glutathione S-transferase